MHIPVEGFMYPNEIELHWSVLIVLYPFITGLVAGAFILASLERVFRVEAVKPTYRLALLTALSFLLVGCDRQISNEKSTTQSSDGTVKSKEKTVTESSDGTVTKTEETKKSTPAKP